MSARKFFAAIAGLASVAMCVGINAQTISTYAGGGAFVNAPALSVAAPSPLGAAIAPDGTVYYAAGSSVYRLNPSAGTVTAVAGNGIQGYSGDGGPATSAELAGPWGVAVDAAGNLYIADVANWVIRRVDAASGTITTVAGNGTNGYSGDGGPATSAQLNDPQGVAVDGAGNLYIADANNKVVRRVDASSGTISTVAGNGTYGYSGDGGPASSAELSDPYGVAVDAAGNLYIADYGNYVIRRVDAAAGTITTVAGNGTNGYSGDGGPATSAQLREPQGVAVDSAGNLYIADAFNQVVRRVDASSGTIITVAGNGTYGYSGDGGPATGAELAFPFSVAVDSAGNLYIADGGNNVIRGVVAANGTISTITGDGTRGLGGDGGPATGAQLNLPFGVGLDAAGNLYIADYANNVVRRVDATSGMITTVAGNGTNGYSGDGGPATSAQLYDPQSVAVDGAGNLYIADANNKVVRRVDASSGTIITVAGNGIYGYSGDGGPATSAELAIPVAVAVDSAGNLFIADVNNDVIRRVDASSGTITTIAGNGSFGYSGDGGPATNAQFSQPFGIVVDRAGNLYVSDIFNSVIRRVDASSGTITTIAGTGTSGYSGDGGPATSAQLFEPVGVALDAAGNLYVGEILNNVIRRVDVSSGMISTVAGNDDYGFSGDGGPATSAEFARPAGVAVDAAGKLYISDTGNERIRVMSVATSTFTASPGPLNFGSETTNVASAPMLVTVTNTGNMPVPITVTRSGANPGQFTQTNNCGTSVAVRTSCTISVQFDPTSIGSKTATLNIDSSSAGTQTVVLTGTGVTSYTVSPTSLAFGAQAPGTSSTAQSVTVTNNGSGALPITGITLSGTNPGQFTQTHTCGTSVPVGSTCTINIVFKPTVTGPKTATLNVNSGAAGTRAVGLTGTGAVVRTYTVSPTSLAFGNQRHGTSSAAQAVTVTNTGTVALPITTITLSGANPGQFSKTTTCTASVAVGASCTISIVFKPIATGSRSATLSVNAGGGAGTQSVSLSGAGT